MLYKETTLKTTIEPTVIDKEVSSVYEYAFNGECQTTIKLLNKDLVPKDFGIGLILGKSGGGKTTNLKQFGVSPTPIWDNKKSVCSNFNDYDTAFLMLHGVGFNSIRAWTQPRYTLSNGEGYRADIAKTLKDGSCYDEFCSYLDIETSKSLSMSLRRLVDSQGYKGIVVATCRDEILDWLQPDWVFNVDDGTFEIRGSERRFPKTTITIYPCDVQIWDWFKNHHYLNSDINKGSACWVAFCDGKPAAFYACLAQPSGTMQNAWRGTRLVVLPEFQGRGISTALTEYVAGIFIANGKRFFAKTASALLGEHRERSSKWKPTSKNKKLRKDYLTCGENKYSQEHLMKHHHRICYSHEFVG